MRRHRVMMVLAGAAAVWCAVPLAAAAAPAGTWGTAIKVPGVVESVSCVSAGYCAAAGNYFTADRYETWVDSES